LVFHSSTIVSGMFGPVSLIICFINIIIKRTLILRPSGVPEKRAYIKKA